MRSLVKTMTAFGVGAGTMFFLDARLGPRRRALVRDKTFHYARVGTHQLSCFARDVVNHARGWMIEATSRINDRPVSDDLLVKRVRSKIGRAVTHPHALDITARDRIVVLSGPILADEVPALLRTVMLVRGVKEIHNQLSVHADNTGVPSLQGEGRRTRVA